MAQENQSSTPLESGLYESILDEELNELLIQNPDMVTVFEAIDDESIPGIYSQFVWSVLSRALQITKKPNRLELVNRLIQLLSSQDGLEYTKKKQLLGNSKPLLKEVRHRSRSKAISTPATPLSVSSLLTGAGDDPQLDRELRHEMMSADEVDILVSFIKWSGLSLLRSAFEYLNEHNIPVRIITTSYMGASDPEAVEWLAEKNNISVKVSYDTERTRLHAKAYHFMRRTGFSTAYIGSANISRPAITSGLEWTVKVTEVDMPHILARFRSEFETYWARDEFIPFQTSQYEHFRNAIQRGRYKDKDSRQRRLFFADIKPYPYQERILEALTAVREAGSSRNLIVAATGTGKTIIAGLDYRDFHLRQKETKNHKLLFVVHRKEILEQSIDCFRTVLKDHNFGELLVDGRVPENWNHVFASVQSLNNRKPWKIYGEKHFDYIIVDEAHHGTASSYRAIFDRFSPKILLGLTATPERMDGSLIVADFDNCFAAEIRLPEALEEKLLCPFHYFGITDPVSVSEEHFWKKRQV